MDCVSDNKMWMMMIVGNLIGRIGSEDRKQYRGHIVQIVTAIRI